MRNTINKISVFILLLVGLMTSCSPDVYIDAAGAKGERPIPDLGFEKLFRFLHPDKEYDYWALVLRDLSSGKFRYVLQVGDKSLGRTIGYNDKRDFPVSYYIAAIKDGKVSYFEAGEETILEFLGEIDTLQEALILASCYGYRADYVFAGSYHILNGNYVMQLSNKSNEISPCHEIAEVTVTKDGFLKTRVIKAANNCAY